MEFQWILLKPREWVNLTMDLTSFRRRLTEMRHFTNGGLYMNARNQERGGGTRWGRDREDLRRPVGTTQNEAQRDENLIAAKRNNVIGSE